MVLVCLLVIFQGPNFYPDDQIFGIPATPDEWILPSYFDFQIEDVSYRIYQDGFCEITDHDCNSIEKSLSIPIYGKFPDVRIESISALSAQESRFFIIEINNGGFGHFIVAKMAVQTLDLIWLRKLPGFNTNLHCFKKGSLYMTCIGTIWKIDGETGEIKWKVEDLYRTQKPHFNFFSKIRFEGEEVIFTESPPMIPKKCYQAEVRMKDQNGKEKQISLVD